MGFALTNGSLPILLNRKQQINHPNSKLPNINVFMEDRREHSLLLCTSYWTHCWRLAPNLMCYSNPKLLSWLLLLHCLRKERQAAPRECQNRFIVTDAQTPIQRHFKENFDSKYYTGNPKGKKYFRKCNHFLNPKNH